MSKIDQLFQKIIELSFYALFFITPLLFDPLNSELFELPKMFFVWALTIVIVGAWILRTIINGRIVFQRTLLDLPLLLFLLSQVLSFRFSIDSHTSFWGYYSRFNGGLLSTISYTLLYWAFVSNMDAKKSLFTIHLSLITGLLVALWGIPAHFGFDPTCLILDYGFNTDCWSTQFVPTQRIFSTLGQPNWLASWLVALAPLAWSFALSAKLKMRAVGIASGDARQSAKFFFYLALSTILLLALAFTNSKSGFLGLGVAVSVFLMGLVWVYRPRWFKLIILAILCAGIIGTTIFSNSVQTCISLITDRQPLATSDITPSSDIRCIVWKGAINIWQNHPIFGTGPETFAYSYYKFKPPEHNLTSEWDFLYNKAHNEYLNLLANTGIVGLIAYLILIAWIIRKFTIYNLQFTKERNYTLYILNSALLAGWTSLLATNFFGFSIVATQLQFFLYPALAYTLSQRPLPTPKLISHISSSPITLKSIAFIFILVPSAYCLITISRYFLADIHYNRALNSSTFGEYTTSFSEIKQAIELRSSEPLYHDELSNVLSSLALITQGQDEETTARLVKLAHETSDAVVANYPQNINFWKTRTHVLLRLSSLDTKFTEDAREAFEKTRELAPTDAKTFYELGIFYTFNDELEKAQEAFEKALALRPNYEKVHLALEEIKRGKQFPMQ